jgi:hypothetical protein
MLGKKYKLHRLELAGVMKPQLTVIKTKIPLKQQI